MSLKHPTFGPRKYLLAVAISIDSHHLFLPPTRLGQLCGKTPAPNRFSCEIRNRALPFIPWSKFGRLFSDLLSTAPNQQQRSKQKNKRLDCQLEWPHEKTWEDNEISWTSTTKVLLKVQCARSGKKMYEFPASKTAKSSMNTRNASVPEVLLV